MHRSITWLPRSAQPLLYAAGLALFVGYQADSAGLGSAVGLLGLGVGTWWQRRAQPHTASPRGAPISESQSLRAVDNGLTSEADPNHVVGEAPMGGWEWLAVGLLSLVLLRHSVASKGPSAEPEEEHSHSAAFTEGQPAHSLESQKHRRVSSGLGLNAFVPAHWETRAAGDSGLVVAPPTRDRQCTLSVQLFDDSTSALAFLRSLEAEQLAEQLQAPLKEEFASAGASLSVQPERFVRSRRSESERLTYHFLITTHSQGRAPLSETLWGHYAASGERLAHVQCGFAFATGAREERLAQHIFESLHWEGAPQALSR